MNEGRGLCEACQTERSTTELIRVLCLLEPCPNHEGDRFYVCRATVEGASPECFGRRVMGVDIHRIEMAA